MFSGFTGQVTSEVRTDAGRIFAIVLVVVLSLFAISLIVSVFDR